MEPADYGETAPVAAMDWVVATLLVAAIVPIASIAVAQTIYLVVPLRFEAKVLELE